MTYLEQYQIDRIDALHAYLSEHYDEDPQSMICDILADTMHITDRVGADLDDAMESARMHYDAERQPLADSKAP